MSREHHGYRFAIWVWILALTSWAFLAAWALAGPLGLPALGEPRPRFWLFVSTITIPTAFVIRHASGWVAGTLRVHRLLQ